VETGNGGYLLYGERLVGFQYGYRVTDSYYAEIDTEGNTLWWQSSPGGLFDGQLDAITRAIRTSDGGFVLVELSNGSFASAFAVNLLRIDALGTVRWNRRASSIPFLLDEQPDGTLITLSRDISLTRYSADGELIENHDLKDEISLRVRTADTWIRTSDGAYVMALANDRFGPEEFIVVKVNPSGTVVWEQRFESDIGLKSASVMVELPDGGYLVAVEQDPNDQEIAFFELDAMGNMISRTVYDLPGHLRRVISLEVVDDGILLIGETSNLTHTDVNILLVKLQRRAEPTAVDEAGFTPRSFALDPPYPNPASGRVTLAFQVPEPTPLKLEVFDLLGRRVAVLAQGMYSMGRHEVRWEALGLQSGVYLCRLHAGTAMRTRLLSIVK